MKRILCVLLCLTLAFVLVSCSTVNLENNTKSSIPRSNNSNMNSSTGKKSLVVYFSATGNTKSVAEMISKNTNSDIFEIIPENPYTGDDLDWTNDDSRVSVEHNDESKRMVTLKNDTPDNWSEYDTVYIGYPIWWGLAAWPVSSFVKANDFKGKTVIPFCTSASSGLGNSTELLKASAGGGNWLDGKRFSSGASENDVNEWIHDLFS